VNRPLLSLAATMALGLFVTVGCGKTEPAGAAGAAPAGAEAAAPTLLDNGPAGDVAKGEAVYGKICVACHQADGGGNGGMLAASFLKDKSRLAKPDSVLYKSISEGLQGKIGVMPAQKGVLSDQEIKDVIAYVRSKFGGA
jgi:mono/diheme cytochrome c family protein